MSHRAPFIRVLLPLLALTLQACAPEDETPTPTVGPTLTPTPVPDLEPWYQVSRLNVLPDGVGLDLDGNGSVDNALEATLDEIVDRSPEYMRWICGEDACTTEEAEVIWSASLMLQTLLTPASLEIALMTPLLRGDELLYFHQEPHPIGWFLFWSENPPDGNYLNHYTEAPEQSIEGGSRRYLDFRPQLAAEYKLGLPEEVGASYTFAWTFAPFGAFALWIEPNTEASEQIVRMGGRLDHDALMAAFEEYEGGCIVCADAPCPDLCQFLYETVDAVSKEVFAEDLDGNGNATIGMGLDITGQKL